MPEAVAVRCRRACALPCRPPLCPFPTLTSFLVGAVTNWLRRLPHRALGRPSPSPAAPMVRAFTLPLPDASVTMPAIVACMHAFVSVSTCYLFRLYLSLLLPAASAVHQYTLHFPSAPATTLPFPSWRPLACPAAAQPCACSFRPPFLSFPRFPPTHVEKMAILSAATTRRGALAAAPKRAARLVARVAQPLAPGGAADTAADAAMLARAGLPPTTTPFDNYVFAPIREAEVGHFGTPLSILWFVVFGWPFLWNSLRFLCNSRLSRPFRRLPNSPFPPAARPVPPLPSPRSTAP